MKILFTSRAFANIPGGVQKTATDLMNEMAARGHQVFLLTWDQADVPAYFNLDQSIEWRKLGITKGRRKSFRTRWQRAMSTRRAVKDSAPDLILAYQEGMFNAVRMITAGSGIPVIAAERNSPSRFSYTSEGKKRHLFYTAFRFASAITVQCRSYIDLYPRYLRSKITAISNPVYPPGVCANLDKQEAETKTLLSVGRFSYQKNFQSLIEAFILIADQVPEWNLTIVGDGDGRASLERLIDGAGLQSRILLPGSTKNMAQYYRDSDLFCLPSRWEGFPNALAEAMASGLPGVGFNDCHGVSELIINGRTGLLAKGLDDAGALAGSLLSLMKNKTARIEMGLQAAESVRQYEPSAIFDQWEDLFRQVARG